MSKSLKKEDVIFPTLYGESSNGKIKVWNATVTERDKIGVAIIVYGFIDGKQQTMIRECREGKNIGKKNETTPFEQCVSETRRKWVDKRDKEGYVETPKRGVCNKEKSPKKGSRKKEKSVPFYRPMLAHTYNDSGSKIQFPCFVQPKLDGLRCIVSLHNDTIYFQSRTGGQFTTLSHLVPALRPIFRAFPNIILDGELYTMEVPFEELAGLIKRKTVDDPEKLELIHYHIYDIVDETLPYRVRYQMILDIFSSPRPGIELVQSHLVHNFIEAKTHFSEFVAEGYEGIMLRNMDGRYRCNYRSYDLQKYKEFMEEEFPIVGFRQGEGKDRGTVIWVCRTKEGNEFSVRPRGKAALRREWFENGGFYIGKPLTVIFQEWSDMKIPRFPVGKSIRDGF